MSQPIGDPGGACTMIVGLASAGFFILSNANDKCPLYKASAVVFSFV
ncbi:MAG: hypothetical protein JSU05_14835, partial [Bacteroidetes bacterium]|nr:hypothetical protein [Bacteroidota bacterium]